MDNNTNVNDPDTTPKWKKIARAIIPLQQRTILAIMVFIGMVVAFGMRICLSITIISLVEPKGKSSKNITGTRCDFPPDYNTGSIDMDPIYTWDEALIGFILSSFYIGYVICHIPGGIVSDIIGGKPVLAVCVVSNSIFTILTPVSIDKGGPYVLMAVRILMGAMQGALFPSANVLLAAWIPPNERTFYGAMVFASSQIGTIYGTLVPGVITATYHSCRIVFYIFGVIGVIWGILFVLMCSSDPSTHGYISNEEKDMLQKEIGNIQRTKIKDAPWLAIVTNVPVVALIVGQIGHDFGFFIMVTDLPKYMSDVLHYNIHTNSFLSSLPFIAMFVVSGITGILADVIIRKNIMSLVNCRKLFTALGACLPAVGMILASYAGCNRTMVVVWFVIGMALMGFFYSGMRVNGLDLSPRYAGTVMAVVNGIGGLMGIIAPSIVGLVTKNSTVEEFRIVFWIAFILLYGTTIVYVFFASGDVQPFNEGK